MNRIQIHPSTYVTDWAPELRAVLAMGRPRVGEVGVVGPASSPLLLLSLLLVSTLWAWLSTGGVSMPDAGEVGDSRGQGVDYNRSLDPPSMHCTIPWTIANRMPGV